MEIPILIDFNYKSDHLETANRCILTINFLIASSKFKGGIRCPISLPDIMGHHYRMMPKGLLRLMLNSILDVGYEFLMDIGKGCFTRVSRIADAPKYFIITWEVPVKDDHHLESLYI